MLFDFTEAEQNTARRALEFYESKLKDEIGKTKKRENSLALVTLKD